MNDELQDVPDEVFEMGSLLFKYIKEETTVEEKALVEAWLAKSPGNQAFFNTLNTRDLLHVKLSSYLHLEERRQAAAKKMLQLNFPTEPVITRLARRWKAIIATGIMVAILAGAVLLLPVFTKHRNNDTLPSQANIDVPPGFSGAVLELANGEKIILDSAANGLLARQGASNLTKNDGQLAYAPSDGTASGSHSGSGELLYNTLATPRGRQFHLVLPDGSHAWLNAASSIRFPTSFTDKERKVEISGEVYFEIKSLRTKNGKLPFTVLVPNASGLMEVQVLGTHFNVNAYTDEPAMRTTLVEGSVQVRSLSNQGQWIQLKPGEQSVLRTGKEAAPITVLSRVDVEPVLAWKDGSFHFTDESIQTIMRQLARWYDVDIIYERQVPPVSFVGGISRNTKLSEVIAMLETNDAGIHFELSGKQIRVK